MILFSLALKARLHAGDERPPSRTESSNAARRCREDGSAIAGDSGSAVLKQDRIHVEH
jgi:hypothetical protein